MRLAISLILIALFLNAAYAQDTDIQTALRDYLSKDPAIRDSAEQALYEDALRRKLGEERAYRRMEFVAETRRLDRHLAGAAGPSGSTALTALSGVSDLFSTALESGIVNRSTDGSVATFRLNASGVVRLFDPQEPCFLRSADCRPTLEQRVKALSLAASFEQAKPEAEDPMTTGTIEGVNATIPAGTKIPGLSRTGEIRNVTARWEIRRRKSLADANIQNQWREAMKEVRSQADTLGAASNTYIESLRGSESWKLWKAASTAKLDEIAKSNLEEDEKVTRMTRVFQEDLAVYVETADENVSSAALNLIESTAAFRQERNKQLHEVLYPVAATVEYLYQKPANQPDYSTMRLIIGKPFGQQRETKDAAEEPEAPLSQFTANFAASLYHGPPADAGSFRDVQAAVQLDRFMPIRTGGGQKAVLSIAGYYQYLAQRGVLQLDGNEITPLVGIPLPQGANVLLDTTGSVFVAQAKLTLPLGDSGVNFPIAVSWANRSEFIKARVTKLNFGFTFDLHKLIKGVEARD
jgi:hypothetical protein